MATAYPQAIEHGDDNFVKELRTPVKPKLMSFVCDKEKLQTEVNKLCKLVERVGEMDYKSKTQSIISVCDKGTGNEQLNYPYSVTVDHNTGNIYVADNFATVLKYLELSLLVFVSKCLHLF